MGEYKHTSVLLNESIEALHIKSDGFYVDGTLGGAGHSSLIAEKLTTGKLIGVDRDSEAIRAAEKRLGAFGDRVCLVKANYGDLPEVLDSLHTAFVDGILLDLGVSSYQLDNGERGFSYMQEDAPLDMRMEQETGITAGEIRETYSKDQLEFLFREYGEEKFAKRIAAGIVAERERRAIKKTGDLNRVIREAIPAGAARRKGHPSKRVFQALRIETNSELSVLSECLPKLIDRLSDGGRLCCITFHSLEDRIVKNAFKAAQDPCTCPKEFPVCVCGKKSKGKVLVKKPILPSAAECEENARSRSAKLRVFERRW